MHLVKNQKLSGAIYWELHTLRIRPFLRFESVERRIYMNEHTVGRDKRCLPHHTHARANSIKSSNAGVDRNDLYSTIRQQGISFPHPNHESLASRSVQDRDRYYRSGAHNESENEEVS